MSISSPKQKYLQLKDWLPTFIKATPKTNTPRTESRMDYYKKKGN